MMSLFRWPCGTLIVKMFFSFTTFFEFIATYVPCYTSVASMLDLYRQFLLFHNILYILESSSNNKIILVLKEHELEVHEVRTIQISINGFMFSIDVVLCDGMIFLL